MPSRKPLLFALALAVTGSLRAASTDPDHPQLEGVKPVDNPAEAAGRLALAPGLRADLWAAEPDLQNPVSFGFDEHGRCYVSETFRRKSSALDIRQHRAWLAESLAMRSVADRLTFLQGAFTDQKLAPFMGLTDRNHDGRLDWRDLAVESERITLLEDRNGQGRADHTEIFAEGFDTAVTGIGAGVLAHDGDVFFTCLPDVWKFHDGKREPLLSGFGVHITYSGHDLHGLTIGPDGRLYWSIGDCGARVTTKEGTVLDVADTGAVFRSELDGSHCEVVMRGLRNPEELCFNDVGDLFTADNNGDGGDLARWVQVVEGGDAGWQIGFQALPGLGSWVAEKWWSPEAAKTAFALLPPVGTVGHGPAGITYYPGTGLPDTWRDHFFVCDFPGGVRTFTLSPEGASYRMNASAQTLHRNDYALEGKLVWGFYPTDVEFGVDGGVYVLDWVRDVEQPDQGRIFRLHDPATDESPIVQETKRLLAEGMSKRPTEELGKLLAHADRRVRLAAQFELVKHGDTTALAAAAQNGTAPLQRLHAIWGLGQLGRQTPEKLTPIVTLLQDRDAEVRAQTARLLGDAHLASATSQLITALGDAAPRVRFFAALALGKLGSKEAVAPLLGLLRENANADAFLRHAGVTALAQCANLPALLAASTAPETAVRAGSLLALRRQGRAEVARFLQDADPQLVLEAARAIYDAPIAPALPALAALTSQTELPAPVMLRAINANFFLGDGAAAERLATLAVSTAPEALRVEAIEALGEWNQPLGRDRFLGGWRPLPVARDSKAAANALHQVLSKLLVRSAGDRVRLATINASAFLKLEHATSTLASITRDPDSASPLRVASLQALASMVSPLTADALSLALKDHDPTLRARALELEGKLQPEKAIEAATNALKLGSLAEKQSAFRTLGALEGKDVDKQLGKWLDRYNAGEVPTTLHLDLFEAASHRDSPELKKKLADIEAARGLGRLGPWRECISGGDAARGREIFSEKAEAGCLRCHKVRGVGGEVGPDLSAIGARLDRVAILKAILFPNDTIAPGFENTVVTLKNGAQLAGIISSPVDGSEQFTLRSLGDGKLIEVRTTDVAQRTRLPSPMPEGLGPVLGKRDLRDVVEFLSELK